MDLKILTWRFRDVTMQCHEPRTNAHQQENTKKAARGYSTQRARGGAGQDRWCASLSFGLPQIRFLTPSAVSADPVDPPFVTFDNLDNVHSMLPCFPTRRSHAPPSHTALSLHSHETPFPSLSCRNFRYYTQHKKETIPNPLMHRDVTRRHVVCGGVTLRDVL